MAKRKFSFTNRAIDALPAHDADSRSSQAEYTDTQVVGLRLSVGKSGSKTFSFRYQLPGGRKRVARIGVFPATSASDARVRALEMRAVVDRGGDPQSERERIRSMPTFAEFVQNDYLPYARVRKRSIRNDESKFRLHLVPRFGRDRLCDISKRDIQSYHTGLVETHSPATANRHLALLGAVFRYATEMEVIDRNPVTGVRQFKEEAKHERYLTKDETRRLVEAMDAEPNRTAAAALKLLLLTGTRREEALKARWEHVNFETGRWWLPRTKSGKTRYVVLHPVVASFLAEQPSRGTSEWVFPGRDGDKPLHNPRKAFTRILEAAGIEHMRIHDLRHNFASLAVNSGVPLYSVQGCLGHSTAQMTQRYAHLADTALRDAGQAVADAIASAVGSRP